MLGEDGAFLALIFLDPESRTNIQRAMWYVSFGKLSHNIILAQRRPGIPNKTGARGQLSGEGTFLSGEKTLKGDQGRGWFSPGYLQEPVVIDRGFFVPSWYP